jgi:hypothetical protein
MRQDCGLPKHDLFMTFRLISVNFWNRGKLLRVFPMRNLLLDALRVVRISGKMRH